MKISRLIGSERGASEADLWTFPSSFSFPPLPHHHYHVRILSFLVEGRSCYQPQQLFNLFKGRCSSFRLVTTTSLQINPFPNHELAEEEKLKTSNLTFFPLSYPFLPIARAAPVAARAAANVARSSVKPSVASQGEFKEGKMVLVRVGSGKEFYPQDRQLASLCIEGARMYSIWKLNSFLSTCKNRLGAKGAEGETGSLKG